MTHVGRKDKWSRVADRKGEGIASKTRDRDSTSGGGACRKFIGIHDKAYETEEGDHKDRDRASNPKRALAMTVSVIDSVV